MRVVILPLNSDNYGYLLIDEATCELLVVDVSMQPNLVMAAVAEEEKTTGKKLKLTSILTTHRHADHAGGNNRMKELNPGVKVYCSAKDNVEGCTDFVTDGQILQFGTAKITCMLTPGHTMGHITYFLEQGEQKMAFTGDFFFVGGCGRFFEGSASDMYPALFDKLCKLPDETLIYCGHEYTVNNYRFALSVDPANSDLIEANKRALQLRTDGKPTIPSTLKAEKATNPFLRIHGELSSPIEGSNPVAVLAMMRKLKDDF